MKIKLDENIGRRGVDLLEAAGHDVATVLDQRLQGASDQAMFNACRDDGRVLVTLDHDFAQIRIVRTIDPADLRRKADDLSRRHRILDVAVQEANWSTELID